MAWWASSVGQKGGVESIKERKAPRKRREPLKWLLSLPATSRERAVLLRKVGMLFQELGNSENSGFSFPPQLHLQGKDTYGK